VHDCCGTVSDFRKMFLMILGSVVLGALIWFLLKKDPEPVLGIYSQPGIIVVVACILSYFSSDIMITYILT